MQRSSHSSCLLLRIMAIGVFLLPLIVGCSPSASTSTLPPTAPPEMHPAVSLTLSGSNSVVAIISAIQPSFESARPDYHLDVTVRTGASASAAPTIQGVAERKIELAAIPRPLTADERTLGIEDAEFGKMATALLTHPGIGVKSLTSGQVREIFAGKITNWAEVGGPKLPIVVVLLPEDSAGTVVMRKVLFGEMAFTKQAQLVDKSDQVQVTVEGTPGSIGYSPLPGVLIRGSKIAPVALDGIGPDDAAYPITQPIALCYRSESKERIQPLIDWLVSEPGRAALHKIGVITGL